MNSLELIAEYSHYYETEDDAFLEILWASYTANSVQGDPNWLMPIGPPSGGRSTAIRLLKNCEHSYTVDGLTEHTLVTGLEGATSVLNELDGKVLVMEDGGFLQSLPSNDRNRIFAQLRKAYDGDWRFKFGTKTGTVSGKGKFGVLMACTPAIDSDAILHAELGERFLKVRPRDERRQQKATRAIQNIGQERQIYGVLSKLTEDFVASKWNEVRVVLVDPAAVADLASVADLVARARTPVKRGGSGWHIVRAPMPESPARLTKQIVQLAESLAKNREVQRVTCDEIDIVHRVAADCIPPERLRILEATVPDPSLGLADLARRVRLPRGTVRNISEDLVALDLLEDAAPGEQWDKHEYTVSAGIEACLATIIPSKAVLFSQHITNVVVP